MSVVLFGCSRRFDESGAVESRQKVLVPRKRHHILGVELS